MSQLRPTSITAVNHGDVMVISIVGPVSSAGGDLLLRARIAEAIAAGERKIALEFTKLSTFDSSGLGELVRASGAIEACGGRMAWVGCPTTMLDLLEITCVEFVDVEFVETIDAAIEALS